VVRSGPTGGLDTGDDVRLIAQIADGQAGALAELYRRRGGPFFGSFSEFWVRIPMQRRSYRMLSWPFGVGPVDTIRPNPAL
jgi:hypothetical protein